MTDQQHPQELLPDQGDRLRHFASDARDLSAPPTGLWLELTDASRDPRPRHDGRTTERDARLGTICWSAALLRHFRQLDAQLRRSPKRIAWIASIAAVVASWGLFARPTTDVYGDVQGSATAFGFMLGLSGLIAIFGLWRSLAYAAKRRANPEADIVVSWSATAGPKVVTTIIDGGPKLGVDTPINDTGPAIDDWGAENAWQVGSFGGGHPLLALGVLAVSAAVNGASYLMNRGENQAKQAALQAKQASLTAEYVQFSRDRLSEMSRQYSTLMHQLDSARIRRTSAKERIRLQTLLNITDFALQQVRAAPDTANSVVLTKEPPPKVA